MLQKFTPVANLPMVSGGARNLLDGSKCAAMLELVQSFNVGEMIDEVLKGVNLSSLIENDVAE